MEVFEGESANEVWRKAVDTLRSQRGTFQTSRAGNTYEIIPAAFTISDPRKRWVVSRQPAISVAFALVDVIGIIAGRRDSGYLNHFNPALPRYAGRGTTYHGAYGYRLRANFAIDQMKRAAEVLSNNPDSRQVVMQIWDPSLDLPQSDGRPQAKDIPCNVCSILKVRNGRLFWTQVMRSNDLFRGTPYNFVQFTTLHEVISGWLGIEPGPYTHLSDSLHVYTRDAATAFAYSEVPEPIRTDSLSLPYERSEAIWRELNEHVDVLAHTRSADQIGRIVSSTSLPEAFANMLRIVAADAARRLGANDCAHELSRQCNNPVLSLCWDRWYQRVARKESRPATSTSSTTL
jgi:thymidylate synthase